MHEKRHPAMRIIVCGSRNWSDRDAIRRELERCPLNTVILHGDGRGADRLAATVGSELGFEVVAYPADRNRYGIGAGPRRNKQMLDEGKPDLVLAFTYDIEQSRDTRNMVKLAQAAGVEARVLRG